MGFSHKAAATYVSHITSLGWKIRVFSAQGCKPGLYRERGPSFTVGRRSATRLTKHHGQGSIGDAVPVWMRLGRGQILSLQGWLRELAARGTCCRGMRGQGWSLEQGQWLV